MKTILRNLLLLAMAWAVGGVTVWAGEKPATPESAQAIEQMEWNVCRQFFDDLIGSFIWEKKMFRGTGPEAEWEAAAAKRIAELSKTEPPLKMQHRLNLQDRKYYFNDFEGVKQFMRPLEKGTFESFVLRNKETRQLPLGHLTTPLGKIIQIVNEDATRENSVIVLSRVGFSPNGRQALLRGCHRLNLYQFENDQWKLVAWVPF